MPGFNVRVDWEALAGHGAFPNLVVALSFADEEASGFGENILTAGV
jgi:hypothetical protein